MKLRNKIIKWLFEMRPMQNIALLPLLIMVEAEFVLILLLKNKMI